MMKRIRQSVKSTPSETDTSPRAFSTVGELQVTGDAIKRLRQVRGNH